MTTETFGMGDPIRADSYEGFVEVMRDWLSAWERPLTIEAEELPSREIGSCARPVEGPRQGERRQMERAAPILDLRDGLVVDYGVYRDRDEARTALEGG